VDLASRPEAMAISVLITLIVIGLAVAGASLARRAIRQVAT
jgi:hypothetical protein